MVRTKSGISIYFKFQKKLHEILVGELKNTSYFYACFYIIGLPPSLCGDGDTSSGSDELLEVIDVSWIPSAFSWLDVGNVESLTVRDGMETDSKVRFWIYQ